MILPPLLRLLEDLLSSVFSKIIDLVCILGLCLLKPYCDALHWMLRGTIFLAARLVDFNADGDAGTARVNTARWLMYHPASVLCLTVFVAWAVRRLIALVKRYRDTLDEAMNTVHDTNARDRSAAAKRCPCLMSELRDSGRKSYYERTRVERTRMPFAVAQVATIEEKIEEGNEEEAKREEDA